MDRKGRAEGQRETYNRGNWGGMDMKSGENLEEVMGKRREV